MYYVYADGELIYRPLDEDLALLNPRLILEIGKAGSFEFEIPPTNEFFNRLNQLTTEIVVDMDDDELFRGRVLSNERSFSNTRKVYVEGILAYLVDSVQKGAKYSGTTHDLFRSIIANHNARVEASKQFTVGNITIENRSIILVGQEESEYMNVGPIDYKQIAINSIVDEWNNTFDYIQTCLIDYCGGYLRARREGNKNYIDLLVDFQSTASQEIELGENLLDLNDEVSAEDLYTVLIPLGDENLTIAAVNGGSDEIVDEAAVARYGRIVRTHVFSNVNSPYTLYENGVHYLYTSRNVPRTVEITAVDLHLINPAIKAIHLGDKVKITSNPHDIDEYLTCTKIEVDLANPAYTKYTFGNPKQSLTERFREDIRLGNDTYGNSAAGSAGGGAGAAAGAAGWHLADKEEKDLKDFYDAWINIDEEHGHIDLGTLYGKYLDGKEVLLTQCGIDLDSGPDGSNINIKALNKTVDDHGVELANQKAQIEVNATNTEASIKQVTSYINKVEDDTRTNFTKVEQRSSALESNINLVAGNVSSLDQREKSHYASISLRANNLESEIVLKADKVTVDGLLQAVNAKIDNLMAGKASASKLLANYGSFNSLWVGGKEVCTYDHSHEISVSGGRVSFGRATTSVPQSFNIADTQFYKDGVKAVTISSLGIGQQTYNEGSSNLLARLDWTLSNGNTGTKNVYVDVTRPYQSGQKHGYENGYEKGKTDGYQTGYSDGSTDGYQTGMQNGYNNGYSAGYSAGHDDGFWEGANWAKGQSGG